MILATVERGVISLGDKKAIIVDEGQLAMIRLLVAFHEGSYESQEDAPFDVGVFEEVLELLK